MSTEGGRWSKKEKSCTRSLWTPTYYMKYWTNKWILCGKFQLKTGYDKIVYWLCRFSFLLGFLSDESSERNLSCFFTTQEERVILLNPDFNQLGTLQEDIHTSLKNYFTTLNLCSKKGLQKHVGTFRTNIKTLQLSTSHILYWSNAEIMVSSVDHQLLI